MSWFQSEKLLLFDTVQSELEEKIRRLEEDRHSIDITSELWNDELQSRRSKKKDPFSPDKKKKPVAVSDILFVVVVKKHFTKPLAVDFFGCSPFQSVCFFQETQIASFQSSDILSVKMVCCPEHVNISLILCTTIYCLYAAGLGHPRGLDSHQKGVCVCVCA